MSPRPGIQRLLAHRGGIDLGRQLQKAAGEMLRAAEFNRRKREVDGPEPAKVKDSLLVKLVESAPGHWCCTNVDSVDELGEVRGYGNTPEQARSMPRFGWALLEQLVRRGVFADEESARKHVLSMKLYVVETVKCGG